MCPLLTVFHASFFFIVAVLNEFLLVGIRLIWVCSLTLRNKPAVASRGLMPSHALARCSIGRPVCLSLSPVGGQIAFSPADWYIAVDGAGPLREFLLEAGVMADVVIGRMEWVDLRSVWPHEERNFTPWLLENLDLLSGALGIELHSPSKEVSLRGAGRADIVAYVRSDAGDEKAVIENQFGMGDEEHFTRLLGYAEAADASVLVWVASEFSRRHEKLVKWFNRRAGAGLAVYLVEASAWRIGDVVGLFLVVREGPQPVLTRPSLVTRTLATSLGDFYRPLVARLRASGVPTVGRGGYRGRWRSFPTGQANVLYALGVDRGRMWIFCGFLGLETARAYPSPEDRRDEINAALAELDADAEVEWDQGGRDHWVSISRDLFGAGDAYDEESRDWMFDNFLGFRGTIQPFLDELFSDDRLDEQTDREGLSAE